MVEGLTHFTLAGRAGSGRRVLSPNHSAGVASTAVVYLAPPLHTHTVRHSCQLTLIQTPSNARNPTTSEKGITRRASSSSLGGREGGREGGGERVMKQKDGRKGRVKHITGHN